MTLVCALVGILMGDLLDLKYGLGKLFVLTFVIGAHLSSSSLSVADRGLIFQTEKISKFFLNTRILILHRTVIFARRSGDTLSAAVSRTTGIIAGCHSVRHLFAGHLYLVAFHLRPSPEQVSGHQRPCIPPNRQRRGADLLECNFYISASTFCRIFRHSQKSVWTTSCFMRHRRSGGSRAASPRWGS